ncbi:unnamed protein product [Amoebophrya sp. A120]|nr:unnamed protein product [Amoebophrya sp. A120]|eukprot:GSA120T00005233001.1
MEPPPAPVVLPPPLPDASVPGSPPADQTGSPMLPNFPPPPPSSPPPDSSPSVVSPPQQLHDSMGSSQQHYHQEQSGELVLELNEDHHWHQNGNEPSGTQQGTNKHQQQDYYNYNNHHAAQYYYEQPHNPSQHGANGGSSQHHRSNSASGGYYHDQNYDHYGTNNGNWNQSSYWASGWGEQQHQHEHSHIKRVEHTSHHGHQNSSRQNVEYLQQSMFNGGTNPFFHEYGANPNSSHHQHHYLNGNAQKFDFHAKTRNHGHNVSVPLLSVGRSSSIVVDSVTAAAQAKNRSASDSEWIAQSSNTAAAAQQHANTSRPPHQSTSHSSGQASPAININPPQQVLAPDHVSDNSSEASSISNEVDFPDLDQYSTDDGLVDVAAFRQSVEASQRSRTKGSLEIRRCADGELVPDGVKVPKEVMKSVDFFLALPHKTLRSLDAIAQAVQEEQMFTSTQQMDVTPGTADAGLDIRTADGTTSTVTAEEHQPAANAVDLLNGGLVVPEVGLANVSPSASKEGSTCGANVRRQGQGRRAKYKIEFQLLTGEDEAEPETLKKRDAVFRQVAALVDVANQSEHCELNSISVGVNTTTPVIAGNLASVVLQRVKESCHLREVVVKNMVIGKTMTAETIQILADRGARGWLESLCLINTCIGDTGVSAIVGHLMQSKKSSSTTAGSKTSFKLVEQGVNGCGHEAAGGASGSQTESEQENAPAGSSSDAETLQQMSKSALEKLVVKEQNISRAGALILAEALRTPNATLAVLDLSNNHLGLDGVDRLGEMLFVNKSLKELYLRNVGASGNFWNRGLFKVVAALEQSNTTLELLDLGQNNIKDKTAGKLGEIWKKSGLKKLFLSGNWLAEEAIFQILESVVQHDRLEVLDLGETKMGRLPALRVGTMLRKVKNLKTLLLQKNQFGKHGAAAIFDGLKANRSVKRLDLMGNEICDHGAVACVHMLCTNKTLKYLDLQHNHLAEKTAKTLASVISNVNLCPQLTVLKLQNNKMTAEQIRSLRNALSARKAAIHPMTNAALVAAGANSNEEEEVFQNHEAGVVA